MKKNWKGPGIIKDEWHGKIGEFIDVNMQDSAIYASLTNNLMTSQKSLQDRISILDIPKIHMFTENEKFYILSDFFSTHDKNGDDMYFDRKNNLITPSWLNYINQLLNDAVDYYQNYLLRTVWKSFIQKWNKKKINPPKISLKETKDVLDFLEATSSEENSKADRQIDCSLLKISLWLHQYKSYESELSQAESKFKEIKEKHFFTHFYDEKDKEIDYDLYKKCFDQPWDCDYVQLQTKPVESGKSTIFFKTSWRIKDPQKIVLKMLSNRKYDSLDAINDIYGIRNEVGSRKDALLLLEYLRKNIFEKQWEISDKNIFVTDLNKSELEQIQESIDFIISQKNELDSDFYEYILSHFQKQKEKIQKSYSKKDSNNNKNYRDIKIISKLWWKKIETQINLINNKNERAYAHHLLYDAKAKIATLVRLQSYISEPLIKRYIKEAIEKNIYAHTDHKKIPELLQLGWFKWNYQKITETEKIAVINKIFLHMYQNEMSFIKLDIPGRQHQAIYTTIDHWNAYHYNTDYKNIYPDWAQVKIDNKRINKKI